ncbi:MAG: hypothetical protein KKF50_04670 [Nanoarchaeota archaeon]|nr:hypothetical protein [Nanoarchaeota archaeon]
MVKGFRLFLLGFVLVVGVFLSFGIVSADFANCWDFSGTTSATCTASNGGGVCQWKTSADDGWCYDAVGCCMDIGCWDYDGTNQAACETNNGLMNCTWDPYMTMWYPNGTAGPAGMCMMEWTGDMVWGGMTDGPWVYNGDKAACGLNNYIWKANDAN